MPEARVFRPHSEMENNLIDKAMEVHAKRGDIEKASWTQYAAFLVNKDITEIITSHSQRMKT